MNNKGFSFIEFIIVMAIMAVVSGLSFMTFNAANKRQPSKTRDNFKNYVEYSSQLVKAEDKQVCLAVFEIGNTYYGIVGLASGDSQADLISSFKSAKKVAGATSSDAMTYVGEYDLADFTSGAVSPLQAREALTLGNKTNVHYTPVGGSEQLIDASNPVIIKFRKFDGSVIAGAGEYRFAKRRTDDSNSFLVLEESTGNIRLKQ